MSMHYVTGSVWTDLNVSVASERRCGNPFPIPDDDSCQLPSANRQFYVSQG